MIDFSQCKTTLKTYRGANGNKISIIYNDKKYMLKFPSYLKNLNRQIIKGNIVVVALVNTLVVIFSTL